MNNLTVEEKNDLTNLMNAYKSMDEDQQLSTKIIMGELFIEVMSRFSDSGFQTASWASIVDESVKAISDKFEL